MTARYLRSFTRLFAIGASLWLARGDAVAQSFPPDAAWKALTCGNDLMTDGLQDEVDAVDERDVVGALEVAAAAAGWRAADDDYLYLRIRLDRDPAAGGALSPFAWGIELDLDGDLSTYEVLIAVDGEAEMINVFENTTTTLPDDPGDPADLPPVASYPFTTHGRAVAAPGTDFGGDTDFFIDMAAAWADLAPTGMQPDSRVYVWAASSTSPSSLDGDFACHDGATGAPSLSDIDADQTVLDPRVDSDGDGVSDADELDAGTDPDDPADTPPIGGDTRYEGGGGCALGTGGGTGGAASLALLGLAVATIRRRG